jgi:hypothetical protein
MPVSCQGTARGAGASSAGGRQGLEGSEGARQQPALMPGGWRTRLSRTWQKRFYYNTLTGQTQWNRPTLGPAPLTQAPARGTAAPLPPTLPSLPAATPVPSLASSAPSIRTLKVPTLAPALAAAGLLHSTPVGAPALKQERDRKGGARQNVGGVAKDLWTAAEGREQEREREREREREESSSCSETSCSLSCATPSIMSTGSSVYASAYAGDSAPMRAAAFAMAAASVASDFGCEGEVWSEVAEEEEGGGGGRERAGRSLSLASRHGLLDTDESVLKSTPTPRRPSSKQNERPLEVDHRLKQRGEGASAGLSGRHTHRSSSQALDQGSWLHEAEIDHEREVNELLDAMRNSRVLAQQNWLPIKRNTALHLLRRCNWSVDDALDLAVSVLRSEVGTAGLGGADCTQGRRGGGEKGGSITSRAGGGGEGVAVAAGGGGGGGLETKTDGSAAHPLLRYYSAVGSTGTLLFLWYNVRVFFVVGSPLLIFEHSHTGYFPPHRPSPQNPVACTGSNSEECEGIGSAKAQSIHANSPPPTRPVPASPREREVTRRRLREVALEVSASPRESEAESVRRSKHLESVADRANVWRMFKTERKQPR